MKNYNKILEAINKGIQLALDDFDDEEQVQHVKSKQVLNRDYTKEYLDLMEEVVDLGLPSGTLWCKYNLGATCEPHNNISWYGNYYAWGELKPNKPNRCWYNYKFGKEFDELTKYCNNSRYGLKPFFSLNRFTDNLTLLLSEDDAAYQNKKLHNYKFHIPTKELFEELINYTNSYWVNNYNPNKIKHNSKDDKGIKWLNGRIFEGKNGNQLFIPAAGYHLSTGSNITDSRSYCYLWSSSLYTDTPHDAYELKFDSDHIGMWHNYRYAGRPIRPVINL